jgi:hypothetical protein
LVWEYLRSPAENLSYLAGYQIGNVDSMVIFHCFLKTFTRGYVPLEWGKLFHLESPNVLDSCDSCFVFSKGVGKIWHSRGLEQQAKPAILGNPLVIEHFANWKTTMKLSGKSYLYMFIIYRPWLP